MVRASRAKLFLPFDALKGFNEALKEREVEYEERKELAEDACEELEMQLNRVERDTKVKIKYYKNKRYITLAGKITNIDYMKKKIQIDEQYNINVCDIIDIKVF